MRNKAAGDEEDEEHAKPLVAGELNMSPQNEHGFLKFSVYLIQMYGLKAVWNC